MSKNPNARPQQSILLPATVIKNKWKVQGKIGQGSFGEIYAVIDLHTSEDLAVKVEKLDDKKMVLKQEVIVIKQLQTCPHVIRYIHSGRQEHFNFLIMERLGENLAELRKQCPGGVFSMCTSLRLGIHMIEALEGIHKLGFIHRDVKPSNFVMGPKNNAKKKGRAFLIDFGLARKFRLPSGEIRPPRKNAGFRGTARYASINSHHKRELGRVDDIWSVFYAVVEFLKGSLPWMKMKDKDQIGQVKEKETNPDLCKDLPPEFLQMMEHLQKLKYEDEPDYVLLKGCFQKIYERERFTDDMPFDWEMAARPMNAVTDTSGISEPPVLSPPNQDPANEESKGSQKSNRTNKKAGCKCCVM